MFSFDYQNMNKQNGGPFHTLFCSVLQHGLGRITMTSICSVYHNYIITYRYKVTSFVVWNLLDIKSKSCIYLKSGREYAIETNQEIVTLTI